MRGLIGAAGYLPHRRLDRGAIAPVAGGGGGRGTRTVASYDEDTTTMAVEAARLALRPLTGSGPRPDGLWFATVEPAYLDKTNATTVHAALRLDRTVPAFDAVGSVRSAVGALRAALEGRGTQVVASADIRVGLPGGPDEAAMGDGAAALVVGDDTPGAPVLAELLAWSSTTEELIDRWRTPGEVRSRLWEERFGETRYVPLGQEAWDDACKAAGVAGDEVGAVVLTGTHGRACAQLAKRLELGERRVDDLGATVGMTGAAHPGLLLTAALEQAAPGQVVALVVLADGADVALFRATPAVADHRAARPVAEQAAAGAPVDYGTYLRWRGLLATEPPRRPEPARTSSSAASRSTGWKLGLVGSADDEGNVHTPPRPGDATEVPMADAAGTIATFTIDRMAYSPSPPVVFAVVDFDGGGRLPVELTDVDGGEVRIGDRVEPTFRRLSSADGIHNYFWKARPVAGAPRGER
jgi:hydroxymethylglutaryl-CoA synthase